MAQQFGIVASGTTASSAFTIRSDRPLALAISSHAALGWHVAFQTVTSGVFLRTALPATGAVTAAFSGSGGAIGLAQYPPSAVCRIETSATVSATTSFSLIELSRWG